MWVGHKSDYLNPWFLGDDENNYDKVGCHIFEYTCKKEGVRNIHI